MFWHHCTLNPSILAAIKLSDAKRFANQGVSELEREQPAAVKPHPRSDNYIPDRFVSRSHAPQYARGTPSHANGGFDPFSGR